ncbi:Ankyrin repeat and SOCS box protein 2 (ASB-2) [Durusdinium trenchii]|uniref:Ankyrin repeat and SOCS box protein 2 (ASB-2) n=1 Tax=Durusdinium trenchii TaxID=1381693 RepID=A0ABP0RS06_9DINO
MPKETLRRREQKAAAFAVRSGTAERRPLEAHEAQSFFRAIDARDAAGFGIRKLSLLDVDSLHEAPECITWEHRISLLYYAAWRKRDHFVSALLHARANPSVREEGLQNHPSPARSEMAMHIVDGLRTESAVWLCHALVHLRFRGKRSGETGCCEECKTSNSERAVKGFGALLAWPCGHRCCEDCLWQRLSEVASSKGVSAAAELLCLNCGGPALPTEAQGQGQPRGVAPPFDAKKEDWQCCSCGYSNFARRQFCRNCEAPRYTVPEALDEVCGACKESAKDENLLQRWQLLTSAERRTASMERFLSLLDTEPATDANAKTLARFQPQNPRAAASMRLGDTQQERSAELHKASSACDTLRIMALLEAGVDIDASNEYGQTAIFLAAYYDAAEAVKLLAWSGADVDRPANGGTSPWMCAAVNGFKGVLEVLSEAGAKTNNLSEQIDFGISTPKLNWLIPADSDVRQHAVTIGLGNLKEK